MSVSPLRIRGEEPSGAVMVLRDITRLTSLERELKERHGKSPKHRERKGK
jgi:hypothetical protein